MTNSADPDQLALQKPTDLDLQFAKTGHVVFSKRRVGCNTLNVNKAIHMTHKILQHKLLCLEILYTSYCDKRKCDATEAANMLTK